VLVCLVLEADKRTQRGRKVRRGAVCWREDGEVSSHVTVVLCSAVEWWCGCVLQ